MTNKEKALVSKICKNVNSPLKPQIETVVASVLAMQTQLEDNHDDYLTQPLSIQVTVGTGETINRANPFVAEYRALFKDYVAALKSLKDLMAAETVVADLTALSKVKEKFKIAK